MRCKACNKTMDTPANWLNPEKEDDDMCAECVTAGDIDWDTREYAFGYRISSGITKTAPDYDKLDKKVRLKHALHENLL